MKQAIISLLIAIALANVTSAQSPKVTLTSAELGQLPNDYRDRAPVLSPDCNHIAFLTRHEGKWFIVRDGVETEASGWVLAASIAFSPDSKTLVHVVQNNKNMTVLANDKPIGTYRQVPLYGVTFSPDSQRLAFPASKDGERWLMVESGKEGREYARVCPPLASSRINDPTRPRFSADSKRFGYGAVAGDGKAAYVIDGQETGDYEAVLPGYPIFSPDAKHVAYAARLRGPANAPAGPASTQPAERVVMFIDGKESPAYEEIALGTPVFSADSSRYAYPVKTGGKSRMITETGKSPAYDLVGPPVFSPDSKSLAYAVQGDGKRYLVLNGKESGPFEGLAPPIFSPDSQRVAYHIIKATRHIMVVDGKEIGEFDGIADATFSFSPDSRRYAFVVRRAAATSGPAARGSDTTHYVIDGVVSPAYDSHASAPAFSPDSKHVVYAVRRGEKQFLVVDGQETGQYDMFIYGGRITFDSPATFHVLVVKERRILRLQGQIQ